MHEGGHTLCWPKGKVWGRWKGVGNTTTLHPLCCLKSLRLCRAAFTKKRANRQRENALVEQKIEPGKVNRKMVHGKLPILMLRAFPRLLCFPFSTFTIFAANCIRLDTKSINFMLTRFSALIEDVQENIFAFRNKYFLRWALQMENGVVKGRTLWVPQ